MAARRAGRRPDPNEEAFRQARQRVTTHPMFRPLCSAGAARNAWFAWSDDDELADHRGWARVREDGKVVVNRRRRADADEWYWVLVHCLLHLGFGHLDPEREGPADRAEQAAACLVVARFQHDAKLGRPPGELPTPLPAGDEARLAARWRESGVPDGYADCGVGGHSADLDRRPRPPDRYGWRPPPGIRWQSWPERFAVGLAAAASAAVEEAGAPKPGPGGVTRDNPWERARRWFVSSYPLLGALAAGFRIVADVELARSWDIAVAAVDAHAGEIYVNPLRAMPEEECRFVLAHEMLHAALRHADRVAHRDPFLWNVATDYVINGWLVEMGVGVMPDGLLHDPQLRGLSSEAVYDRIATDLRRHRRLATLRGAGLGDMLGERTPGAGEARRAVDLDEYYRRALTSGLAFHESAGRGLLPAGLVAEIRVLDAPPPPWDVQLARWFDEHFPARERQRSYARPSRRQASTPGIPRPGWHRPEERERRRTFGVVLDTSGSMSARLMGRALGAVASYALARDVPAARVVFCDAVAYDAGYLPVEEIAGRVRVRGRGGTVLQPGIRLLERAEDFPSDGPILVVTDGECDVLRIRRDHAFLVPAGARLPFTPRGPVFRMT
ncbi:vWA domain-containing protein [Micromonospora purpureochromogenes]|uniref:vWA domain-containing protein n=1 Tax=Micromonospora purpureochromogenes TaxID=47872 RepID=UPI003F4D47C7